MKYLILILAVLSCAACAKPYEPPKQERDVAPELEPWVQSFEATYGVETDYIVQVADLAWPTQGLCRISNGFKTVTVSTAYYSYYMNDYYAMEQLIYHELGHCSLGLDHNTTMYNGYPISIMYPYTFVSFPGWMNNYIVHRNDYINEL